MGLGVVLGDAEEAVFWERLRSLWQPVVRIRPAGSWEARLADQEC